MPPKKKATGNEASANDLKPRAKRTDAVKPRAPRKMTALVNEIPANAEERIEESKYYPGPVMQKFEEPRAFELPQGYGDNRIVVMVRDPYWLYTYWEINQSRLNEIKAEIGEKLDQSRLILRVYDANTWSFFDLQVHGLAGNWYINVGRPNTAYCVDVGFLTQDGVFVCAARSNVVTTPRDRMSEVIDEQWMTPDWDALYALSGGFRVGQGSFELREMMEKRLMQQLSSGGVSSLFSPSRPALPRPFWLVANCELIVYGATEPTARVTIQGQPIKLREDGTFSVRYALPDGRQTIPIEATRDDGKEKKRIIPVVERRTG